MRIDRLFGIPPEVSRILPSKEDLENAQISFDNFLNRVYPKVSNDIFPMVQEIVQGFGLYCNHNLDGGFAKVQRGAMRTFFFNSARKDERRFDFIAKLPKIYQGQIDLTKKVVYYTFPGVTDLDIRFNFKQGFRPQMEQEIYRQLFLLGFESHIENDEVVFFNQSYMVKVERYEIGKRHKRPVRRVHFTDKNSRKKVFILDLAGLPENQEELGEDLKNSDIAADVDKDAQGILKVDQKGLLLNYSNYKAFLKLAANFFNKNDTQYRGFLIQTLPELIAGFREASFRGAYYELMYLNFLFAHQEIPNLFNLFIGVWSQMKEQPRSHTISEWIMHNHEELREEQSRLIPFLSSGLFCLSTLMGLPTAYFNGYYSYTPLGRIIGDNVALLARLTGEIARLSANDFMRKNVYEIAKLQNERGFDPRNPQNFAPFVIIRCLKDRQLIAPTLEENLDTAIALVNPLLYNSFPYSNLEAKF